jgi:hypothetical protein
LTQQISGQAVLLGALAVATALMVASQRPLYGAVPAALTLPVGWGWLKLQARLKREGRLDNFNGA